MREHVRSFVEKAAKLLKKNVDNETSTQPAGGEINPLTELHHVANGLERYIKDNLVSKVPVWNSGRGFIDLQVIEGKPALLASYIQMKEILRQCVSGADPSETSWEDNKLLSGFQMPAHPPEMYLQEVLDYIELKERKGREFHEKRAGAEQGDQEKSLSPTARAKKRAISLAGKGQLEAAIDSVVSDLTGDYKGGKKMSDEQIRVIHEQAIAIKQSGLRYEDVIGFINGFRN